MAVDTQILDFIKLLPALQGAPEHIIRASYDAEADVLYISLGEPREADDSDMDERGVLTRYAQEEVIGYTILNASKFGNG